MGLISRRGRLAASALAAITVFSLAACGTASGPGATNGKIKLVIDQFGDFGYEDLITQYMGTHPKIEIELRGKGLTLDKYSGKLTQQLVTGKGAGDIIAIEEGLMIEYKANPNNFVNLLEHGGGELQKNFLPWKWDAGLSTDKSVLLGLGTDVGGMAICYRKDLFKEAGLPTAREEVSALWPTWQDYIVTGEKFAAANTGAAFLDGAAQTFNVILLQEAGNTTGFTYYDTTNNLAVETNPAVRKAFDVTADIIDSNLSGRYKQWEGEWTTAFKQAKFATIACPAWMTGVIEGSSGPDAKGDWDIARIPGNGGNWGGSHLSVPKQSKHQAEAIALVKFLTSKEGQIGAFTKIGALPSNPEALDDPTVKGAKNAYFGNAPVGSIFGDGAKTMKPVYMGPKNQAVRTEVEGAVRQLDLGKANPADGWNQAVQNAIKAADK